MKNKKEKLYGDIRCTRVVSMAIVAVIALIVFVGIVPAEDETRSITTEAAQSMNNAVIYAHENSIENTSFEIKVLQGNERLKLPEKRMVGTSQERSKDISLPIVSQNNKGLRVSSFSRGATAGTSGVINVSPPSATEEWKPSKPSKLPYSVDMLKLILDFQRNAN
ncbi:MAG: hypothetical protein U9Q68_04150 [Euryarchaeota archaeon]|nr:hypothetical protein [Euryarchaeota archaeon]